MDKDNTEHLDNKTENFINLINSITGKIVTNSNIDNEGKEYWDCIMIKPGLADNGFYYTDNVLNTCIDKFKF